MDLSEIRQRVFRETRSLSDPPTTEDVDDAVNLVQRTYIQSVARLTGTATYTTTGSDGGPEVLAVASLAPDLFELRSVLDLTDPQGYPVQLLGYDDTRRQGIRREGDDYLIQYIQGGHTLKFIFWKRLLDVGPANPTPAIDARWHDLYWLGAASYLFPGNQALMQAWMTRLDQFRQERERAGRGDRRFQRQVLNWE